MEATGPAELDDATGVLRVRVVVEDLDSKYRDYYVWRDEPQDEPDAEPVFPDAEDSVWTYDDEAEGWYLPDFHSHQPDLNVANPEVREELAKVAGFCCAAISATRTAMS